MPETQAAMKIGARLRQARLDKKLSQAEVAYHLDISQKTLSNIESDKSDPAIEQLAKMSELYEIDILKLLQQEGLTFNQHNQQGGSNGIVHHHHYSKKPGEEKKRWEEQKETNNRLKKEIASLKGEIARLGGKAGK